jgi:SAM-dependent methyltransferase
MDEWKRLEFEYAAQLRSCDAATRRRLYGVAYSDVARLRPFHSDDAEQRTAGASRELIDLVLPMIDREQPVLEIGCGRGYTCTMLAPHVQSIVGTDVSAAALAEAREALRRQGIGNATIEEVSALDLRSRFEPERFGTAISIQVLEHLHRDDAADHLRQVFELLKPGGRYIILMPNRLTGPHDITREEYPQLRDAIGFHLNESTYRELAATMHAIGYRDLRSFVPWPDGNGRKRAVPLPYQVNVAAEAVYAGLRTLGARARRVRRLLKIRLIGRKPG